MGYIPAMQPNLDVEFIVKTIAIHFVLVAHSLPIIPEPSIRIVLDHEP